MDSININSFNGSEMVEVFCNGITRCIAPQDIATRFFTELTDGERTEITDDLIIDSGRRCCVFSLTDDRCVALDYAGDVRGEGNDKSITLRITRLAVYA
ncbi:MAG: hypothetical protein LBF25_01870 [Puniceicoccales bacterium]|jgi:hypothetical protein|nr:hypothetical protein [Puniceicoccales bacterium]